MAQRSDCATSRYSTPKRLAISGYVLTVAVALCLYKFGSLSGIGLVVMLLFLCASAGILCIHTEDGRLILN